MIFCCSQQTTQRSHHRCDECFSIQVVHEHDYCYQIVLFHIMFHYDDYIDGNNHDGDDGADED